MSIHHKQMNTDFGIIVAKSVETVPQVKIDLAHAERLVELEHRNPIFMEVVGAIVEAPMDAKLSEQYGEWMEEDIRGWANWVRSTFGSIWGDLADVICEEGY